MKIQYTNIFHFKALQNPNWDFLYETIPSCDTVGKVRLLATCLFYVHTFIHTLGYDLVACGFIGHYV
jgi:hypothetical protein